MVTVKIWPGTTPGGTVIVIEEGDGGCATGGGGAKGIGAITGAVGAPIVGGTPTGG
jgi:hypothetical protein